MTTDLSLWTMLGIYALMLVPLALLHRMGAGLTKKILMALGRMTLQLVLIGLYLKFLFAMNSLVMNVLWMLIMLVVANYATLDSSGLNRKYLFVATFKGIALSSIGVAVIFVCVLIRPSPFYDSMYLIPVFGMILGNCMRGNVLALERFFNEVKNNPEEYFTSLSFGATPYGAVKPYMVNALRASAGPLVATMTTMGIVALPGMMTGQILGGAPAMVAIKYQLAIMVAIFVTLVLGAVLNLRYTLPLAFDEWGKFKERELFKSDGKKRG